MVGLFVVRENGGWWLWESISRERRGLKIGDGQTRERKGLAQVS